MKVPVCVRACVGEVVRDDKMERTKSTADNYRLVSSRGGCTIELCCSDFFLSRKPKGCCACHEELLPVK